MDNIVLFLDLDGTLKSEHDDDGPFDVTSMSIRSGSFTYTFCQRPHLHEFLDAAYKKAKLIVCTAAGGGYARKILKEMNVEDYFTEIIAAEDYIKRYNFKKDVKYIFIDNDREMVQKKVDALSYNGGIAPSSNIQKDIWVVDTYHGSIDDRTLLDLKEEIGKL